MRSMSEEFSDNHWDLHHILQVCADTEDWNLKCFVRVIMLVFWWFSIAVCFGHSSRLWNCNVDTLCYMVVVKKDDCWMGWWGGVVYGVVLCWMVVGGGWGMVGRCFGVWWWWCWALSSWRCAGRKDCLWWIWLLHLRDCVKVFLASGILLLFWIWCSGWIRAQHMFQGLIWIESFASDACF